MILSLLALSTLVASSARAASSCAILCVPCCLDVRSEVRGRRAPAPRADLSLPPRSDANFDLYVFGGSSDVKLGSSSNFACESCSQTEG